MKSDRVYFTRLILASVFCIVSMIIASLSFFFNRHEKNTGSTVKALKEWSQKSDCVNEMLEDMLKVQQVKEDYKRLGIGAEDVKITKQ